MYVSDEQPNKDWFQASIGGKKGLVPANYGEYLQHNQECFAKLRRGSMRSVD